MGAVMKCMRNNSSNDHNQPTPNRFKSDINSVDKNGRTLLHHAVLKQQWLEAHRLLYRGIDINCMDNEGRTALAYAKMKEDQDMISLLNDFEADPSLRPEDNTLLQKLLDLDCDPNENFNHEYLPTCLHIATEYKCVGIVLKLLHHGAEVNVFNSHGDSPLHIACRQRIYPMAKSLIKHGAEVNVYNSQGDSPLHIACRQGIYPIVKSLIKHGAEVNMFNSHGDSPLHIASRLKNCHIVKSLIKHGARLRDLNHKEETPIHLALRSGNPDICELVMQTAVKVTLEDLKALHTNIVSRAICHCRNDFLIFVLEQEKRIKKHSIFPLEVIDEWLEDATNCSNYVAIRILMEYIGETEPPCEPNEMAIHRAVRNRDLKAVKIFLQYPLMVIARNAHQNTALHLAAQYGFLPAVQMLLQNTNVDVNARNNQGRTPLHKAAENNNNKTIIKLLCQNGADIHAIDGFGRNVLYIAALASTESYDDSRRLPKSSIVFMLIKMGVRLETNHNFSHILHVYQARQSLAALRTMLEYDETDDWIHVVDKFDRNPLQVALLHGKIDIIDCLISHGANIRELQKKSSKIMSGSDAAAYALDRFCVRMKVAGFKVGQISEGRDSNYLDQCKEEILTMKSTNIQRNFTYYQLLTGTQATISKQFSDKELQRIIRENAHFEMFPIYTDMIDKKLKISSISTLMNDIHRIMCVISKNQLPLETIEYLANFLKRRDFLNLIKAAKPIVKKS